MAKRIICRPTPELEIDTGARILLLRFDMNSAVNMSELPGGLQACFEKPVPELVADIIFSAAKNHNENFTHEDARTLVASCMPISAMQEILDTFSEAVGVEKETIDEELVKKITAQFLNNKLK